MSRVAAKRTSLVLLLAFAAGLALAGSAAAADAQDMACCPPTEMGTGCTWLGAGDCCPERPGPPAQPHAAPPAAPTGCQITLQAPPAAHAPLPATALVAAPAPRTLVLRL